MKSILLLVAMLLTLSSGEHLYLREVREEKSATDLSFRIMEAFRGAWIGFNRGLYQRNNYQVQLEERCLDVITMDNFNDAMLIFQHEDDS